MFEPQTLMLAHMRDDILWHNDWCLTDAERSDLTDAGESNPPRAADVIAELGMSLVAALGFALLVCSLLSAAGIPAP
jgi:hypothetical protein